MSRSKNDNGIYESVLENHEKVSRMNDILRQQRFEMTRPNLQLFPYDSCDVNSDVASMGNELHKDNHGLNSLTFPDFAPWEERFSLDLDKPGKDNNKNSPTSYLTKGYFEESCVSNEYYSGRNLVHLSLFSSDSNCTEVLNELSQNLVNAYKERNEVINKIRYESTTFKTPPRVTLTASKREAWLKALGDMDVPLTSISQKIPHGLRNKLLVETLANRAIPYSRALWFTKCVIYSEISSLRKKSHSRQSSSQFRNPISSEALEAQWIQEWTQQLVEYISKFSKELSTISHQEKKKHYLSKINYIVNYSQKLYIEKLLDRGTFLSSLLKLFKDYLTLEKSETLENFAQEAFKNRHSKDWIHTLNINYGQKLVGLVFIKIFWKDVLRFDYICKELSELLLLNYYLIDFKLKVKYDVEAESDCNNRIPSEFLTTILDMIKENLRYLFKHNANSFIMPGFWILLGDTLADILLGKSNKSVGRDEMQETKRQLDLISYRNESFMLNMRQDQPFGLVSNENKDTTTLPYNVYDNFDEVDDHVVGRSGSDILEFINKLDRYKFSNIWTDIVRSKDSVHNVELNEVSESQLVLKLMINWCLTVYRDPTLSYENVLIVANILKKKIISIEDYKSRNNFKTALGIEILDVIFDLVDSEDIEIHHKNLYVFLNELYQLKILTISSYLRKCIASGMLYGTTDQNSGEIGNIKMRPHIEILKNMPILNNKQCNNILRKFSSSQFDFESSFEEGKIYLKATIVDLILENKFVQTINEQLIYVRDLKVGLKFLLINWLTSELKNRILDSPKLIHLNATSVSNLYNFYAACDNLTVFFKALLKFFLRNEGKIIIYYFDFLYLASKLIKRHFGMIKYLAGTSSESSNTPYELFKLIVFNYKDLSTRDTNQFNFIEIWKFMDANLDPQEEREMGETFSPSKLAASKSTMSPMKLNYDTISNNKQNYLKFRMALSELLHSPRVQMHYSDINEILSKIGMNERLHDKFKPTDLIKIASDVVRFYFENFEGMPTDMEFSIIRLLLNFNSLIEGKPLSKVYDLKLIISESVEDKLKRSKCLNFLKRLVLYEVIKLEKLMKVIEDLKKGHLLEAELLLILRNIAFENKQDESIEGFKLSLLNICRHNFQNGKPNELTICCVKQVKDELNSSKYEEIMSCQNEIYAYLKKVTILNTSKMINILQKELTWYEICVLMNKFLLVLGTPIDDIRDIARLAPLMNEFSLSFCQVLVKFLCNKSSTNHPDLAKNEHNELAEIWLDAVDFHYSLSNSYFGELFKFLRWDLKHEILNKFEDKLLQETKFQFEEHPGIYLRSRNEKVNLVPVFKDFFKKFSVYSYYAVPTSEDKFEDLSKFLSCLVRLVTSEAHFSDDMEEEIRLAISALSRLLVIRKSTLTPVIIEKDPHFTFILNLVKLLNSSITAKDEKLRILLYDILLLMKGYLNKAVVEFDTSLLLSSPRRGQNYTPVDDVANSGDHEFSRASDTNQSSFVNYPENGNYSSETFSRSHILNTIFDLPEFSKSNPLGQWLDDSEVESYLTLDNSELHKGGDVHAFNSVKLAIERTGPKSLYNAFNSITRRKNSNEYLNCFNLKSYEILDVSGTSLNDSCINMSLFDSFTTRENPP